jgi:hypothetical protein
MLPAFILPERTVRFMSWILTCTAIMVVSLIVGGCSSSKFLVYKDGRNFYVNSDCPERQRILCDSGDIDKIVKESTLPNSLQMKLKEGICPSSKVKKSLMDTLDGMTSEQQSALKNAFRRNGYEINKPADT